MLTFMTLCVYFGGFVVTYEHRGFWAALWWPERIGAAVASWTFEREARDTGGKDG